MPVLQGARGGVVDDRVAVDMAERIGLLHVACHRADHHRELTLVVDRVRRVVRARDRVTRAGDRVRPLGEDDRHVRDGILAGAGIEAGLVELLRMLVVVLADAQDVLRRTRDRGQQAHLVERDTAAVGRRSLARGGKRSRTGCNERTHLARQGGCGHRQVGNRLACIVEDADTGAGGVGKSDQFHPGSPCLYSCAGRSGCRAFVRRARPQVDRDAGQQHADRDQPVELRVVDA